MEIKEKIRYALSRRKRELIDEAGLVRAAVLVPLYSKAEENYILFTRRTNKVAYHKGQISFPGGAQEKDDRTLLETALRESLEEINLEATAVEVLGELDDVVTAISNFIVSPFVAWISSPYQFKINEAEIKELVEIPLSALLDRANFREESHVNRGKAFAAYFYEYQGQVIWGATAQILKQLLDIIAAPHLPPPAKASP